MDRTYKPHFHLLAADVDGTLIAVGQEAPKVVIDRLKTCIASGVLVVPATGKKLSSVQKLCADLGITGPVITCNGALVFDFSSGQTTSANFLPIEPAEALLSALREDGRVSVAVFTDEDIICTERNFACRSLAAIGEPTSRFVPDLLPVWSRRMAKILVAVESEDVLQRVAQEYREQFLSAFTITITSRVFVEFMSPGVSKGQALQSLADARGIAKKDIVCIGDSDNDISMFEVSGFRIAVGNGTERILATADAVVPPAAEAGAATAIDRFVLGEDDDET